jgi:hypothetical protein
MQRRLIRYWAGAQRFSVGFQCDDKALKPVAPALPQMICQPDLTIMESSESDPEQRSSDLILSPLAGCQTRRNRSGVWHGSTRLVDHA